MKLKAARNKDSIEAYDAHPPKSSAVTGTPALERPMTMSPSRRRMSYIMDMDGGGERRGKAVVRERDFRH